jgi:hypothetical protein
MSQELYNVFYLNHFADKEIYNMLNGAVQNGHVDVKFNSCSSDDVVA